MINDGFLRILARQMPREHLVIFSSLNHVVLFCHRVKFRIPRIFQFAECLPVKDPHRCAALDRDGDFRFFSICPEKQICLTTSPIQCLCQPNLLDIIGILAHIQQRGKRAYNQNLHRLLSPLYSFSARYSLNSSISINPALSIPSSLSLSRHHTMTAMR